MGFSAEHQDEIHREPVIVDQKTVTIDGIKYNVHYAAMSQVDPRFGYAIGNVATVRDDLPPRVKSFVEQHELYHCRDKATWGGWIGRELRANLIPGLKDPLGLIATIRASLTGKRLKFYWDRLTE